MRPYECIFILEPSLEELAVKEKTERFSEIITSRDGTIGEVVLWGKRKLAYPLNKSQEGIYTLLRFTGNNEILNELNSRKAQGLLSIGDYYKKNQKNDAAAVYYEKLISEYPGSPEAETARTLLDEIRPSVEEQTDREEND